MPNSDVLIDITEEPDIILNLLDNYIGSAYSPQVAIEDVEGGHRLTVTYDDAEQGITSKSFDVLDGEKGETGDTGPVGPVGPKGEKGDKGDTGEQGPQGERGETGPQGERGVQGEKGEKGDKGDTGATGPQGPQGIQGETGPQGPTGATGADGFSPTVDVQPIDGGHEVTITDATGDHSFEVMDGDPAQAGSITDAMLAPDGIKAQVASMWGNRLTGELTGEVLTANDAYTAPPLEVEVDGKSEQVTTTGKNLFDPDRTPGGYYNTSGVFSANNSYVWWTVPVSEGDVVRWANCNNNLCTTYLDGTIVASYSDQRNSGTITIPSGVDEIRGYSGAATLGTAIVTLNNADLTYEPYTGGKPSPSPDYPQEIVSVADPVVTFAGKNLLDPTLMLDQVGWHIISIYAPEGTVLTMSTNYPQTGEMPCYFRQPSSSQGTSNYVYLGHPITQTVGEQGFVEVVQRRASGTDSFANYQWQVEVGSTATAYEPYQGNTVTLPVTLRSLPDGTRDELALTYLRPSTREGWAWYSGEVARGVGHVADMGELAWSYSANRVRSNSLMDVIAPPPNSLTPPVLIAEKYVPGPYNIALDSHPEAIAVSPTYGQLIAYAASASDLPSGEMVYKLATPATETLPEVELPATFGPSCTIYATADATPTLAVTYERDVNITIAALEAAIADLATS